MGFMYKEFNYSCVLQIFNVDLKICIFDFCLIQFFLVWQLQRFFFYSIYEYLLLLLVGGIVNYWFYFFFFVGFVNFILVNLGILQRNRRVFGKENDIQLFDMKYNLICDYIYDN